MTHLMNDMIGDVERRCQDVDGDVWLYIHSRAG